MKPSKRILLIFALLSMGFCKAETFQNIQPNALFGEIKTQFPNSDISRVKAAWVTKEEAFFKLSGNGFPGELYLAFSDLRPAFKEMAVDAKDEETRQLYTGIAEEEDATALILQWMRWVPVMPIPLARYVSKYGKPEKTGFADSNMQPYASWPKKGLSLNLSDDEKSVRSAEFYFTNAELLAACKMRRPVERWPSCEKNFGK